MQRIAVPPLAIRRQPPSHTTLPAATHRAAYRRLPLPRSRLLADSHRSSSAPACKHQPSAIRRPPSTVAVRRNNTPKTPAPKTPHYCDQRTGYCDYCGFIVIGERGNIWKAGRCP